MSLLNDIIYCFHRNKQLIDKVAETLYSEFMKDVKELCYANTSVIKTAKVDYEMMGLAFRLDKLDKDWCKFISVE